jgi:hypothetical protein
MAFFEVDAELEKLSHEFFMLFDDNIPTYMIPADESMERLKRNIRKCIKEKKNLMDEFYPYDNEAKF